MGRINDASFAGRGCNREEGLGGVCVCVLQGMVVMGSGEMLKGDGRCVRWREEKGMVEVSMVAAKNTETFLVLKQVTD